jgi:hypothetical protein
LTNLKALKENQIHNNRSCTSTKSQNEKEIHFESIFDFSIESKLTTVFILLKERQNNPASKEIDIKDDLPEIIDICKMILIL